MPEDEKKYTNFLNYDCCPFVAAHTVIRHSSIVRDKMLIYVICPHFILAMLIPPRFSFFVQF